MQILQIYNDLFISFIPFMKNLFLVFIAMHLGIQAQQHNYFIPIKPDVLSNTSIRCFFKDNNSFIWFGTDEGLLRYDGTNLVRYEHNPNDETSISHNNVNAIVQGKDNSLWVGTTKGLCKFNREKNNFINFHSIARNQDSLTNVCITSLAIDSAEKLWIGTHGGGINIYDFKKSKLLSIYENSKNTQNNNENYITSLLCVKGRVWCGTMEGLKIFESNTVAQVYPTNTKSIQTKGVITKITKDNQGNVWLAYLKGNLIKSTYLNDQYVFEKEILHKDENHKLKNILAIYSDKKNNIWIGDENSGLNYLKTKNNTMIHFGSESNELKRLPTVAISSIYIDDQEHIWIGTINHGVYMLDDSIDMFGTLVLKDVVNNGFIDQEVTSFAQNSNGSVWLACNNLGLIKLNSSANELSIIKKINSKFKKIKIVSLFFDSKDNLWISTIEGLYKLLHDTEKLKKYNLISGGFGNNKPSAVFEDRKGEIWAGTFGSGLFYLDKKTDEFVNLYEEQQDNNISNFSYISSFAEDQEGLLWVGTFYGLYNLKEKSNHSYEYKIFLQDNDNPDGISSSAVQTVFIDTEDNIWLGTVDNGLNLKEKNSNSFKVFRKKDGLASNVVRGLIEDASGNLWVSSNMGLTKFNPKTKSFKKYTKSDGLISNSFLANSCLVTNKGKLLFGSNKGMNTFYPDSINIVVPVPKMYFTDLKINNESVNIDSSNSPLKKTIGLTSEIVLTHKQRSFTISFTAINYKPTLTYNYCYMLKGFDDDWNCIGSKTSATYTNINPGEYVFLVKTTEQEIDSSSELLQLGITINPIIWLTFWAKLLYVIIVVFIIYFFLNIRMERVRIKNQLVVEKLAREKEHELLESKTQFFTNISHEFRTPLSLISMPLEKFMRMKTLPSSMKKGLEVIQRNSDRMLMLVNELMNFSKMERAKLELNVQQGELVSFIKGTFFSFHDLAEKKNIVFSIDTDKSNVEGWFDHDKLEMILVNLLSNAFKFTDKEGQICLKVDLIKSESSDKKTKKRSIKIQVIDNGIGISQSELPFIFDKFYQVRSTSKVINTGTGIGLSLSKGLVELHHGTINVESIPGNKTNFTIEIPIDKNNYSEDEIVKTKPLDNIKKKPLVISTHELTEEFKNEYLEGSKENVSKSTILIVEDNDELRGYLVLELEPYFTVIEAINGLQGLEIAKENCPDLIISDVMMPIKTGIELCEEIKTNIETSHIPFILLTAKTSINDKISGISTGADVYITKPFKVQFLIAQVKQIIESRQKLYVQFSQNVHLLPGMVTKNKVDKEFLQKVINYIIENVQDSEIGVKQIAEIFNITHKQIYRKIKGLTGKTVVSFIRTVRMKEALKLMELQQYSLKEIAFMAGFNSASYFTTCFKEEYGKTPSEFLE